VMSGKGGVGKSTVSVNLALGLAQKGYKVGLMDVDLHGPDIVRMLGMPGRLDGELTKDGNMPPLQYNDHLKVISLESMMENRDDPIIWRGPLKNQAIRQFIADVNWGDLDYLVIDAPPGTGDEPMIVAHTIKDAKALVVTTPQNIALADVRKAINFLQYAQANILGVVENMSGLACPHCGKAIDLFKKGGGKALAEQYGLEFLGAIPLDPATVVAGDLGVPVVLLEADILRLPGHVVSLASDQSGLRTLMETAYTQGGFMPPTTKAFLEENGLAAKDVAQMYRLLMEEGVLIKVSEEFYYARTAMDEIIVRVRGFFESNQEMGPQDFRDLTELTRKFAIPVLEYLDKEKITMRIGDKRQIRKR